MKKCTQKLSYLTNPTKSDITNKIIVPKDFGKIQYIENY